ncbi:MAG: dephospho-CoA kinase [Gallionella sp.]|jgi:dephospho-CoA kinase
MSLIIGLTGGIGSGKSTVANLFAEQGAAIIDTDAIAHQLTQPGGEAINLIRAAFGQNYITDAGALDRAKMRGRIFSDADAKQQLERILHPLILKHATTQLQQQLTAHPYFMMVVPLLPESPAFRLLTQRVLVVDCDENTQVARVVARSDMSEPEVRNIIAQQTPRAERLHLADDVLHNETGLDNLATQVKSLHAQYVHLQNSN